MSEPEAEGPPEEPEPPGPAPGPAPTTATKQTIADPEIVKLLLGNPGVCVVSDEELLAAISYGDSEVLRRTGSVPSEDNPIYPSYQAASAQFAICLINNKFTDRAKNAQIACAAGESICSEILELNNSLDSTENNTEQVLSGAYQTFPLNPDALYRPATKSRGGTGVHPSLSDIINGDFF